jgi:hypothetical protein
MDESRKKTDIRQCRACAAPLLTKAERLIGIHVACVAKVEMRTRKLRLPIPQYDHQSRQSDS